MRSVRFSGLPVVLFAVVLLAIMSVIILELWNVLMPAIFRLPPITYWQALGLFVPSLPTCRTARDPGQIIPAPASR